MKSMECGDGWYQIIHDMCVELDKTNKPEDFVITKIYDRHKNMDVHSRNGANATRFIIEEYKERAEDICDACGNEKDLEQCDKCTVPVIDYSVQDDSDDDDDCNCSNGSCCGGSSGCGC
jgi:hypothetical protein